MSLKAASASQPGELILYGFFRSSSASRLRIALNLKNLRYDKKFVNLNTDQHVAPEYAVINPSMTVPTLVIPSKTDPNESTTITQSLAALEYLEEVFPEKPLLPPFEEHEKRAIVRALVTITVADTQPTTSLRLMKRLTALTGPEPAKEWAIAFSKAGLKAYEEVAKDVAGKYSVGDEVTLADVCLVPSVWNTLGRFGVALDEYPTVKRVFWNAMQLDAVRKGAWWSQEDCPKDLAEKAKALWERDSGEGVTPEMMFL